MAKKSEPKAEISSLASRLGGTIAGMSAHCARMEKEASELQSRCLVVQKERMSIQPATAGTVASIFNDTLEIIHKIEMCRRMCDTLNSEFNNKPAAKDSLTNLEPNLLD